MRKWLYVTHRYYYSLQGIRLTIRVGGRINSVFRVPNSHTRTNSSSPLNLAAIPEPTTSRQKPNMVFQDCLSDISNKYGVLLCPELASLMMDFMTWNIFKLLYGVISWCGSNPSSHPRRIYAPRNFSWRWGRDCIKMIDSAKAATTEPRNVPHPQHSKGFSTSYRLFLPILRTSLSHEMVITI